MVLLVRESDIAKIELEPVEVIAAVEDAYRQDGVGKAEETPRIEIKIKGKHLPHISPGTTSIGQGMAYLEDSNIFVISFAYHFDFHKYTSEIIDPETGHTIAIVKRSRGAYGTRPEKIDSGMLRTGAAAAIGAKYMANEEINTVGVVGTGRIGMGSLLCLSKVKDFEMVYAHSGKKPDPEFAETMSQHIDAEINTAPTVEEVVRHSDIVLTGTYAQTPIVKGEWLREGTHISGMGADGPMKVELDPMVFKRASRIIVDSEKCLSIGELAGPLSSGVISRGDIQGKIGEVVAGVIKGRDDVSDITVFESDGTIMQSAAVVHYLYQKVREKGLGVELEEVSSFFINP